MSRHKSARLSFHSLISGLDSNQPHVETKPSPFRHETFWSGMCHMQFIEAPRQNLCESVRFLSDSLGRYFEGRPILELGEL